MMERKQYEGEPTETNLSNGEKRGIWSEIKGPFEEKKDRGGRFDQLNKP